MSSPMMGSTGCSGSFPGAAAGAGAFAGLVQRRSSSRSSTSSGSSPGSRGPSPRGAPPFGLPFGKVGSPPASDAGTSGGVQHQQSLLLGPAGAHPAPGVVAPGGFGSIHSPLRLKSPRESCGSNMSDEELLTHDIDGLGLDFIATNDEVPQLFGGAAWNLNLATPSASGTITGGVGGTLGLLGPPLAAGAGGGSTLVSSPKGSEGQSPRVTPPAGRTQSSPKAGT
ncbi:unnamed protein product [Amoebophrya sp. A25]|nr:unnamed protein product [Amoebophrya sp. A25]|eukprot:GSA25T00014648001.1